METEGGVVFILGWDLELTYNPQAAKSLHGHGWGFRA